MRPLAAQCHLGLGRILERYGAGEADGHLSRAVEMLRAMDMPLWLDEAEAALAS